MNPAWRDCICCDERLDEKEEFVGCCSTLYVDEVVRLFWLKLELLSNFHMATPIFHLEAINT